MNRWKAFGVHFAASLAVFLLLLLIIFTLWYPGVLFYADGGWRGLQLVFGVDVVLGPLLTLVVFKAGKPGLKFDLSCIFTLQVVCLLAGTWIVYSERPLALVLAWDTFYSLAAKDFAQFDRDPAQLEQFPGRYPKVLYTELPEDDYEAGGIYFRSQLVDDPLFLQTERYAILPEQPAAVFRREEQKRASTPIDLDDIDPARCHFAGFISSLNQGYVCFDPEERQISRFFPEPLVAPDAE